MSLQRCINILHIFHDCVTVQHEVDHDGATEVARVECESVVDDGVGEPVEVEDKGLGSEVAVLEQVQDGGGVVLLLGHGAQFPARGEGSAVVSGICKGVVTLLQSINIIRYLFIVEIFGRFGVL